MKYIDLIPKNTFIYEYMKCCNNLETAESFDFWGAVWCLSMLCERSVYIYRPNNPLFLNFYITLIADSGIARKSTAINFAKSFIDKNLDKNGYINIITGTTSGPKFDFTLSNLSINYKKCIIGINCSEFITFFKNKAILACLTDLYDCPNERIGYGTIANGDISIFNAFISSFSASSPSYFFKVIGDTEIEGGYISRNIICSEKKGKKRIPWGEESNTNDAEQKFKYLGEKISKANQRITLTDSAIRRYSSWYVKRKLSSEVYSKTFESREQDFVLKLAGILSINDKTFQINEDHIKTAIKIIKNVKNNAQKFFNEEVFVDDTSKIDKTIRRIQDIIHSKAGNGIGHRELYLRVHNSCTNDDFNYIINTMHELGMIEKLQPYNSKQIIYRESKNLFKLDLKKFL